MKEVAKKDLFTPIKERFVELTDAVTFKKECSFALQHFNKNDYLNKATTESKIQSVMNVAQVGLTLNPVMKMAYLVPRSKKINGNFVVECHLEPSYQGLVKLITDTGSAKTVYAHNVYEGDEFEIILGTSQEVIHKPKFKSKIIVQSYAVAILDNGTKQIDVMPYEEILEIRAISESYKAYESKKVKSCIWITHEGEMAKKTVVKRLCKYLPKTDRWDKLSTAISLTDTDFKCSLGQITIIESLLNTSSLPYDEIDAISMNLESLSSSQATETIKYLKENQIDAISAGNNYSQTDALNKLNEVMNDDKK